ncbi:Ig-like domain (group 2) [Lachnospiraceae bacterium XBD2001]|nr:Ig-like domain (group 2) [Lachnospiraceae bacterium XBD2001]
MNKNRKRVTGRVIATACTGLMLMQGVVTPTVMAAELPGSAIEANAYGESSSFTLDSTVKKIKLYETVHLQATLNSKNVEDRYLKWECDNANVANVSNGYITGMNTGRANITVTYLPTGETAHCQLTVGTIPGEDGNEFKLDSSEKKIKLYETIQLKALAGDDVVQDRDLKWESSNKDVANVNNGYVTGMNNGKTTITVTYVPTGLTATCELTVGTIPGENGAEFKIDSSTKAIRLWETVQLKAMAGDDVMADKDIKWESSNPSVATVNNGYVSGISVGTTTIKATYLPSGLVATCEVAVSKDGSVTPEPTPGPGPEDPDPVVNPEVNFTLDANVKTVKVGKTNRILAKVDGKNAATKDLEFSVDKPEIATVNSLGVITGVAAGKAKVTVTYKPTGQTAVCQIAVEKDQEAPVVLEGELALDKKVVALKEGETTKVVATVGGKAVDTKDLKFVSDKTDVAIVRNDGTILGRKAGKAKVTVTYVPTGKTAEVMVAVEAKETAPEVLEGELVLDQKVVTVEAGKTAKVTATINGKEVPRTDLKWTADKSEIAVVRNDGVILGVKEGKAKVTVTYVPTGKTADVMVAVTKAQSEQVEFTLDANVKTVKVGKTNRILAKVDGKNAATKDLEFSVDKPEIATVNSMGVITGVAAGKAKITVTYKPTGQTAVCQIAVEKDQDAPVVLEGEVAVDKKVVALKEGETTKVVATVGGKTVDKKDLKFVSDKTDVAIVRNDGTILGLKAGKAKVTVTYVPTGKTAGVMVAVEAKETAPEVLEGELDLDQKVVAVEAGKTAKVTATINGKEVPRTDLKWTTDKSDIAVVRNDGVILGVKKGKAKVTVTYVPTGKTAEVMVAVNAKQEAVVTGITFDSKIKSVDVGKTTRVLVKVNGQNAKLDDLAFSVDYEQYATVNKMGVITGVKRGRCVVTVTYLPTGETAKLPVSVH